MASRTETYTTRIFLNAEEAKKQLEELTRKTGELRKAKTEAASAGDWKEFNKIKRELDQTVKEIDKMKASSQKVSDVLNNLGKSGIKQIKETMSAINRELSSGAIERGSEEWKNETFKQMDTATSREELNALAGSAGRLGITSKEAIERDQRTGFRVYKWQCPVAFY